MAEHDPKTPDRGPVPNPHAGKPKPRPDAHTRPAKDADIPRPDQYEDLGPVPELFGAAGVEAATLVTDDENIRRAAIERGAEAEGLETAQIFGLFLAIVVVLVLIVVGIWVLTARSANAEAERQRQNLTYRELQENRTHALSLLEGYDRAVDEEARYRIPLERAEQIVLQEYGQHAQAAPYASPADRAGFNMAFPRSRAANFRPTRAEPGVRALVPERTTPQATAPQATPAIDAPVGVEGPPTPAPPPEAEAAEPTPDPAVEPQPVP
jgi:hypothetical protein